MEDIGLDYSLYLHEMYISCCLKRASHVARDVHLMQMDYRAEDGRVISCSRAEGEELVSDQGFDELPAEVRTHHTFHYCAQQESKQRAQPRFQGLVCLAASHQFAGKGSEKGAEDDAPRHEEQPYDGAYEAAARSPPTASAVFAAQHRDEIIQYLYKDDCCQP